MADLFASGRIIDIVIGLVAFEALAFAIWRASSGRGPHLLPFLSNLLSGAFLMIALRNALVGALWPWIAACLLAAFSAHIIDLRTRWAEALVPKSSEPTGRVLSATISLRVPNSPLPVHNPDTTDGPSHA